MKNVLITGGAGFLGSHLAEALIADGNRVLVWDNLLTGKKNNLSKVIDHERFCFQTVDITANTNSILCTLNNCRFNKFVPDVAIHAAASYSDPSEWERDSETNATGTARICKLASKWGVKRLIYFQTSLCYGLKPVDYPLTTESAVVPSGTTYAITKTTGEQIIQMCGVPYISFRLANVCGPRNLSGPVPTFYQRITEGKKCFVMKTRRDFIFAKDLVKVVVRAVNGEGEDNNVYHISTGRDYSIQEMYDAVDKAIGKTVEAPEVKEAGADDVLTLLIDPSKTQKAFSGWSADTPLEEGVEEAVAWYKRHEVTETYTHLKDVKE